MNFKALKRLFFSIKKTKNQVTAIPSLGFYNKISNVYFVNYSTVTDFARFLGLSGSLPLLTAV